jgi:hypothetical protein
MLQTPVRLKPATPFYKGGFFIRQKVKTYFLPVEVTQKAPAKPDTFW